MNVRIRLRNRIGLIILLHLISMLAVLIGFVVWTDSRAVAPLYRLPDVAKVAAITTAFERAPPDTHESLVRAFSDTALRVRLLPALPPGRPGPVSAATIDAYRAVLGGRPFHMQAGDAVPAGFDVLPPFSPDPVRIFVALSDGRALGIEQRVIAPVTKLLGNKLQLLLAVAGVDLVIIFWLADQTTRPVERLVQAIRDDRLDELQLHGPTEITELTEAFRTLSTRLRDLLQERTRMLAAIAHDYRTYLTRLQLRTEFIDDEHQRAAAIADLDEMQSLLDDTLTFARESVHRHVDADVCDLAEELAIIADHREERGETVHIKLPSEPMRVSASHVSLQRMLGNLIDNALRYSGGAAYVLLVQHNGLVRILVEDEGPGVPEDMIDRLLQPFERLDMSRARSTGGVGLGLSIVQALAQRYQGDLRLENRVSGGMRAILTLKQITTDVIQ